MALKIQPSPSLKHPPERMMPLVKVDVAFPLTSSVASVLIPAAKVEVAEPKIVVVAVVPIESPPPKTPRPKATVEVAVVEVAVNERNCGVVDALQVKLWSEPDEVRERKPFCEYPVEKV